MAHELYIAKDGKAAMFYVGSPPWHGLGTRLNHPPTSAEAMKAAKLDWKVEKFPLFARFGEKGEFFREVKRKALMPLDRIGGHECPVFGVVGDDYGIVQNVDAFQFFDPIIATKKATYETAGALGEGERIWILAKIPGSILVGKDDAVDKYLLLANSHTGMASLQIKLTPVRVVCNNTLTMALDFGDSLKIPHFPDVKKRLAYASELIANILKNYEAVEKSFVDMAKTPMRADQFIQYLDQVMPIPELPRNPSGALLARRERIKKQRWILQGYFDAGHPNDPPEIKHTLWSAYNTITFFSDHVMSVSDEVELSELYKQEEWDADTKKEMEKRLRRIWFGDSATLKVKAYNAAVGFQKAA